MFALDFGAMSASLRRFSFVAFAFVPWLLHVPTPPGGRFHMWSVPRVRGMKRVFEKPAHSRRQRQYTSLFLGSYVFLCSCQQRREVPVAFEHGGGWSTETGGAPKVGVTGTPPTLPRLPLLATREDAAATGGGVSGQNEDTLAQKTNAHEPVRVRTHTIFFSLLHTHTHTHRVGIINK